MENVPVNGITNIIKYTLAGNTGYVFVIDSDKKCDSFDALDGINYIGSGVSLEPSGTIYSYLAIDQNSRNMRAYIQLFQDIHNKAYSSIRNLSSDLELTNMNIFDIILPYNTSKVQKHLDAKNINDYSIFTDIMTQSSQRGIDILEGNSDIVSSLEKKKLLATAINNPAYKKLLLDTFATTIEIMKTPFSDNATDVIKTKMTRVIARTNTQFYSLMLPSYRKFRSVRASKILITPVDKEMIPILNSAMIEAGASIESQYPINDQASRCIIAKSDLFSFDKIISFALESTMSRDIDREIGLNHVSRISSMITYTGNKQVYLLDLSVPEPHPYNCNILHIITFRRYLCKALKWLRRPIIFQLAILPNLSSDKKAIQDAYDVYNLLKNSGDNTPGYTNVTPRDAITLSPASNIAKMIVDYVNPIIDLNMSITDIEFVNFIQDLKKVASDPSFSDIVDQTIRFVENDLDVIESQENPDPFFSLSQAIGFRPFPTSETAVNSHNAGKLLRIAVILLKYLAKEVSQFVSGSDDSAIVTVNLCDRNMYDVIEGQLLANKFKNRRFHFEKPNPCERIRIDKFGYTGFDEMEFLI